MHSTDTFLPSNGSRTVQRSCVLRHTEIQQENVREAHHGGTRWSLIECRDGDTASTLGTLHTSGNGVAPRSSRVAGTGTPSLFQTSSIGCACMCARA